ncbi:class I SAM-dependent methyltransferase [Bacteroidota bacterium]
MKILLSVLLVLVILGLLIVISFNRTTSFVNDIDIEEPANGDDRGYTMPSRREVKLNVFFTGIFMKPAYKSIVKAMELKGDETVMDFGSGTGPASELIAESLKNGEGQLTCLDISETWMKVIKKRFQEYDNIEYLLGDIIEMELSENTYDVILIHFVLHDIDKAIRPAIIEKLAYILKSGGRLVIREPSGSDHGMSGEEIKELMSSNGLIEKSFKSSKTYLIMPVNQGIFQK